MSVLKLKTNVGIGDVVHMKQLLDDIKNNFTEIQIAPNLQTIKDFKNNFKEYYDFISKLFDLLFSESPYKINNDINFDGNSIWPDFYLRATNQIPKVPDLEKYLCSSDNVKTQDIIVLTKIRGMHYDFYTNIRDQFLEILNKISKNNKLILMGERNIGLNPEYKSHDKKSIYSIYSDLINNIDNYEDATIQELGDTTPNIDKFIHDCNVMNSSKHVICLSTGGNVSMAMSVSSIINFYGDCEMDKIYFSKMPKHSTKFLTNNLQEYYIKLESLI